MLRYVTSTLVACALAGSVGVLAQESPAPQQPPAAGASKDASPKATLTGCVMEAKTTEGTKVYVLDKTQGGSSPMYALLGPGTSELATNVNKKVEVTGSVQELPPPADGAAADPKVLRPPIVQVESVKVVAEDCK